MSLFSPLKIRDLTFKNRIVVSPMCQYSATHGLPNDWHLVHLGSRAVGGAALIIVEATAVEPGGRISPGDTGIYNDEQVSAWKRIVDFIHQQESLIGVQLAHAGRKASTNYPWRQGKVLTPSQGGWSPVVSASPIAFDQGYPVPHELSVAEIKQQIENFRRATERAAHAGFDVVEVHAAHGYFT